MWEISNHIHNATGFWGPVKSNHAFCESHYVVSPYIAEFYNSISSLVFIALALALKYDDKKDPYAQTAQVWLVLIGLGSMLFHGTMRYAMQLSDEIPMVGFVATILTSKIMAPRHPWMVDKIPRFRIFLVVLVMLMSVGLCICYIVFDKYEIFVHGFTILVLMDVVFGHSMEKHAIHGRVQNQARYGSVLTILLGRVAWESEHRLCGIYPQVWPLHVLWHALSCWSAHYAILFSYLARADEDSKLPQWRFSKKTKRKVT